MGVTAAAGSNAPAGGAATPAGEKNRVSIFLASAGDKKLM